MTVRQRICDALYAAGRIKEAGEALLNIVNFFSEDVYMAEPVVAWLSGELYCLVSPPFIRHLATDFLQRCLSTENSDDTTLFMPPLRVWAKIQLRDSSWNDALTVARNVSTSCVLKPLLGLTLRFSGVYCPKIRGLSGSLRSSRNARANNRCDRVFPPDE